MLKNRIILIALFLSSYAWGQTTLKIATIVPEGTIWTKALRNINREVKRKTKNQIRFVIYADAIAGEEIDIVKKIVQGQLDGALFLQSGLSEILPELNILKLPYFFANEKQWNSVHKKMKKKYTLALKEKNISVLGWLPSGFAYLFSVNPINSLSQFRNSKVWVYAKDPLIKACFGEIHGKGVEKDLSKVLSALKTGEVDCIYASPYVLISLDWHSHVKHCSFFPISKAAGGFVLSKAAHQSIPTRFQRQVYKVARKHLRRLSKQIQKENQIAIKLLRDKYNLQFLSPDAHWEKQMRDFGQKIAKKQAGNLYSQRGLDKAYALLQK